jgi:hypothetical protein
MNTEDKNRLTDVLRSSILTAHSVASRLLVDDPDYKQLQEITARLKACVELGQQQPVRIQQPAPLDDKLIADVIDFLRYHGIGIGRIQDVRLIEIMGEFDLDEAEAEQALRQARLAMQREQISRD